MLQPGTFECSKCGYIEKWDSSAISRKDFPFEKCPKCHVALTWDDHEDEDGLYLYYDIYVT